MNKDVDMFKNAKVGDRVWDCRVGWGKINRIFVKAAYPLSVMFDNGKDCFHYDYTYEGRDVNSDILPSLFWQEFEIPEKAFQKPIPKLEVDTKVIVFGNDETDSYKRYFSHFRNDGKICVFLEGRTSFTKYDGNDYCCWSKWRLADE